MARTVQGVACVTRIGPKTRGSAWDSGWLGICLRVRPQPPVFEQIEGRGDEGAITGCCSRQRTGAGSSSRLALSTSTSGRIFRATARCNRVSVARNTSPIPPSPSLAVMWKCDRVRPIKIEPILPVGEPGDGFRAR